MIDIELELAFTQLLKCEKALLSFCYVADIPRTINSIDKVIVQNYQANV